jgi:thiamine biosynthesis lipoprotein
MDPILSLPATETGGFWLDLLPQPEIVKVYSSRPTEEGIPESSMSPEPEYSLLQTLVRHHASHQAMGTIFSIVAYGPDITVLISAAKAAFAELDLLDLQMSHYRPESELSAINLMAGREPVRVSPQLFHLLETCFRYSLETAGAFDITTGPLMKSWGFFRRWGRVPSQAELDDLLGRIGYHHVHLDEPRRSIQFDFPGIELNLGAIGKGLAVDRMATILRTAGITRALISSGTSSIFALGSPPGKQGWKIALRHPVNSAATIVALRLRNLAISVSGDYENCFELNGRIYSHIMDPRTGMPAKQSMMTAVISSSAAETDALSTAFFIGGLENSRTYLDNHPDLTAIIMPPIRNLERQRVSAGVTRDHQPLVTNQCG